MAADDRRMVQRMRGAAASSESEDGDDVRNGARSVDDAGVGMDYVDAEADPDPDGLMMGDDDDMGTSLRMFSSLPLLQRFYVCLHSSGPIWTASFYEQRPMDDMEFLLLEA